MAEKKQASRNWTFTAYDYDGSTVPALQAAKTKYGVVGEEVCPTTDRHHLQGYIVFEQVRTLSALKKSIHPAWHWEVARGSAKENHRYCTKDGYFVEWGVQPISSAKERSHMGAQFWEDQDKIILSGDHEACAAYLKICMPQKIKARYLSYQAENNPLQDIPVLDNYYIWGPSGSGKTTKVKKLYGESLFVKTPDKWWDGYRDEKTVLIDDLDEFHSFMAYFLKTWADHSPFPVQVKGAHLEKIRPDRFVITSNYKLEDIFTKPQDQIAIKRRFKVEYLGHPVDSQAVPGTVDTFIQNHVPPVTTDLLASIT